MLIFEWNCIENIYYFRLPQFWSTPGWTSSTARGCPTSWCRTWWPPTSSSGSGRSSSPPTTSSTRRWRPTTRRQILPHSSKTASQGAFIYYVRFHRLCPCWKALMLYLDSLPSNKLVCNRPFKLKTRFIYFRIGLILMNFLIHSMHFMSNTFVHHT